MLLTECTGTELNTRELYGDDKRICYGLKCIFYHIFRNNDNEHLCVPSSVASKLMLLALSNFMALYARSFTEYILQYNSEGHWEVKIIFLAA